MKNALVFLIFIVYNLRFTFSDMRFVNYTIISNVNGGARRKVCAESYADNIYLAVKINDVSGSCEGLTWTWGSNQQFDQGFSYLMKIKTIEIYQPSVDVASSMFQWLIPGTFGFGGSLEFYMTTPAGGNWDGFAIDFLDTTDGNFDTYGGGGSHSVLLHMIVERVYNHLIFKTYAFTWDEIASMAIPFSEGSVTKFSIVPHSDFLQVLMDDEHLCQYTHAVNPTTAKMISINVFPNTALKIHNITFIGV